MKVILSIKPEFVSKIFSGEKKYEFRKRIFKNKNIKTIIIYCSAPISKIVGEFEIEEIIYKDLNLLWELTKNDSGISSSYFYKYFDKKEKGFAFKIKSFKKYDVQKKITELNSKIKYAPQSFIYFDE